VFGLEKNIHVDEQQIEGYNPLYLHRFYMLDILFCLIDGLPTSTGVGRLVVIHNPTATCVQQEFVRS
jgi:hypothetical protein